MANAAYEGSSSDMLMVPFDTSLMTSRTRRWEDDHGAYLKRDTMPWGETTGNKGLVHNILKIPGGRCSVA